MRPVTDEWLDARIQRVAIAVSTLGYDADMLAALVELRDRRRNAAPSRGKPAAPAGRRRSRGLGKSKK